MNVGKAVGKKGRVHMSNERMGGEKAQARTDGEKVLRFVTSNENKVAEMRQRLAPLGYGVEQADIGYPEIQADTLERVVEHGLEALAERGEDNVLIEDSGLFIDALDGFPGVFSAYVFRTIGNEGILSLMGGEEHREARFMACMGIIIGGRLHMVEGICEGIIAHELRGGGGFGYDPIFIPHGETRTFGEMSREEKNSLSHRGKATEAMVRLLEEMV